MKTSESMAFVPVIRGQNRLEVKNEADSSELVLIGAIGKSWWDDTGITEQEVRDALAAIPTGKKINARINSEGGSVKEGLGIYNAFKERRADITAHITGYALSIASVFPLGAGKVVSPKSAIWMMHKAWSCAQGNSDDMRHTADMLDAHDETLVDIYASETGKSKAEILSAMEAETWVKGSDAIEFGLADEGDSDEDDMQAAYRPLPKDFLSRCKAPQHILNALSARQPKQGATNQQEPTKCTMNKQIIVALLKKHGIEASETESEEQLQAKLDQIPKATQTATSTIPPQPAAATVTATSGVSREEFDAVKKQLADANEKRIEARILAYVDAGKITNEEAPIFVKAAVADEKGIIAILEKRDVMVSGGTPIGRTTISGGSIIEDLTQKKGVFSDAKKRHETLRGDFKAIYDECVRRDKRAGLQPFEGADRTVFNSNTLSGTITTSFLLDGALTPLQNWLAPLRAFSIDFGVDPYKPLATGVLKNPDAFPSTKTDATDFTANSDSTIDPISVTMHQYTQPFNISNADLNSGLRMQDLVEGNIKTFCSKLIEVATAPITVSNFTGTPITSAPAAFGFSDLATLQGSLKKARIKNVLLDGEYLASISNLPTFFQMAGTVGSSSNSWSAFGWDGIYLCTDWTGAGTNVRGFACHPQAIVGIAGLPLTPLSVGGGGAFGGLFSVQTMTAPMVDISVALYNWFDVNARKSYTSYDVMLGAIKGDGTAGFIIKSA